jgi:hypothetical protein
VSSSSGSFLLLLFVLLSLSLWQSAFSYFFLSFWPFVAES